MMLLESTQAMDVVIAIATGTVLAASAGLRAFMPLFAAGLAARTVGWDLAPQMQWLASNTAILTFGAASLAEAAADKIPVVDHALDAVHTVVGPIAGILAGLSVWLHFPPFVAVILALVVGAPVAGGVHLLAAATRIKSSVISGGTLNPVASVTEDVLSIGALAIVVFIPLLALALFVVIAAVMMRIVRRRRVARQTR
jgi:hypothetical protein